MNFEKAASFIWENGRLLERRIFEYVFCEGSPTHILHAIRAYLNEDGGFGHALEPDLRAPESQPLHVEFGLRMLYECNMKDIDLTNKVCDFVSRHADLQAGIPTIFSSSNNYPRAEHWNEPSSIQPSMDRLTGLVGLMKWQGIVHPWLDQVIEICLHDIATRRYEDTHTILTAFCLLESLPQTDDILEKFEKLSNELLQSRFFSLEASSQSYGLTPLDFSPSPHSYCRRIFSDRIIMEHLEVLGSKQDEDGGWPIQWNPPGEMARLEWRAIKTLESLIILKSYNKI